MVFHARLSRAALKLLLAMGWDVHEYLPILLGLCFPLCGMSMSPSIWANCLNLQSQVGNTSIAGIAVSKLGECSRPFLGATATARGVRAGTSSEFEMKFGYPRYWKRRYNYFARFDEGVRMDLGAGRSRVDVATLDQHLFSLFIHAHFA